MPFQKQNSILITIVTVLITRGRRSSLLSKVATGRTKVVVRGPRGERVPILLCPPCHAAKYYAWNCNMFYFPRQKRQIVLFERLFELRTRRRSFCQTNRHLDDTAWSIEITMKRVRSEWWERGELENYLRLLTVWETEKKGGLDVTKLENRNDCEWNEDIENGEEALMFESTYKMWFWTFSLFDV